MKICVWCERPATWETTRVAGDGWGSFTVLEATCDECLVLELEETQIGDRVTLERISWQ